jgi:hypothetical protein
MSKLNDVAIAFKIYCDLNTIDMDEKTYCGFGSTRCRACSAMLEDLTDCPSCSGDPEFTFQEVIAELQRL